ncbi:odorant-binding protein 1a-like [Rattus rattus]|uniref:odorant-binding protein 1a-like n=1 Tax=Rattus rattus TaxID=10117 RepID=UPI0013F39AC0|nr:odorant-binding protein 1a-like [Rattus rattus]
MSLPLTHCIKTFVSPHPHNYLSTLSFCRRAKSGGIMVKFLLLALTFGLAQAQIEGKRKTVAIASSRTEKIELGGELRIYCRELSCDEGCKEMKVTFYVNENGQCSLTTITGYLQEDGETYRTQFHGDNHYSAVKQTQEYIVFYSENVDRDNQETKLVFVVGNQPLTPEQRERLVQYVVSKGIPPENIRDVLETDTCPDL